MSMGRTLRSKRGFGVFSLGFSASVLGDAITRTTLVWYVFELTGSTVSLGWLSFCFTAPVVGGGMTAVHRTGHLPPATLLEKDYHHHRGGYLDSPLTRVPAHPHSATTTAFASRNPMADPNRNFSPFWISVGESSIPGMTRPRRRYRR